MIKQNNLVLIEDVEAGALEPTMASQLKGSYAKVVRTYTTKLGYPWTSAKIEVLTGKLRSWKLVMSAVHLIEVDWSDPAIHSHLCKCKGEPDYHTPDSEGCLSKTEGPFCGECGLPCKVFSLATPEIEEFQGAPQSFMYHEDESVCCQCQQLFADCNLTQPWRIPHED